MARESTNGNAWLRLAFAYAIQGGKAKAREALNHAELLQLHFNDPWMNRESYPELLACAWVIPDENTKAIGILEDLLSRPGWLTVWTLTENPIDDLCEATHAFMPLLQRVSRLQYHEKSSSLTFAVVWHTLAA